MNGGHLEALQRVDDLYERVVLAPGSWSDEAFTDWIAEVFADCATPSRDLAREVRRCLRAARKLRDFWNDPPDGVPSDAGDWRTRVDLALGSQRTSLECQPRWLQAEHSVLERHRRVQRLKTEL